MDIRLISFFEVALEEQDRVDYVQLNEKAMKIGYFIHPAVATKSVSDFIDSQNIDYNSTFYKTFEDVTSKTRFELLIDQIIHYATTYGSNFTAEPYIPNDKEAAIPNIEKFKIIMPASVEEVFSRCKDILCSGIALSKDTVEATSNFLIENASDKLPLNIDSIKNKEALCIIAEKMGVYPTNPVELLRLIMYITTGNALLIKNKESFLSIHNSFAPFDFNKLNDQQLIALSSIFYRFKPLFIAFKKNYANKAIAGSNAVIINRLRRMAVKNHRPMQKDFWSNVFLSTPADDILIKEIEKLNNFKKVALMQGAALRLRTISAQNYIIRNGKSFVRQNYTPKTDVEFCSKLYNLLEKSLVDSIARNNKISAVDLETGKSYERAKTIRIKSEINIALPASEKNFIGNYPFGTSYQLSEHNYIGIYWENEWGARDFDISFTDTNLNVISWNRGYYNDDNSIVYSGDMTTAKPAATEIIYAAGKCPDGIVRVNLFSGNITSKFRLFFGQENIRQLTYNYMVDPNSIKLKTDVALNGSRENLCGLVHDGVLSLMPMKLGTGNVASRNKYYAPSQIRCYKEQAECFVDLRNIFYKAGYMIVDENYTGAVDIDMDDIKKDTIISLMR